MLRPRKIPTVKPVAFATCLLILSGTALSNADAVVDVDLENLSDPGYFVELDYWKRNPSLGRASHVPPVASLNVSSVDPTTSPLVSPIASPIAEATANS